MVIDIATRLAQQPNSNRTIRPPFLTPDVRAALSQRLWQAAAAVLPTTVIAVAVGMLAWVIATAGAALRLDIVKDPLAASLCLAGWTFVAGAGRALLRLGIALERQRSDGEHSAPDLPPPPVSPAGRPADRPVPAPGRAPGLRVSATWPAS